MNFEQVRLTILAVQREGNRMLAEQLRPLGVTPAQAEILTVLGEQGRISLRTLGELIVCEVGSPSRAVDLLVTRGWVERMPSSRDRRSIELSLSASGRALLPRVRKATAQIDALLEESIGSRDAARLLEALQRVLGDSPSAASLERRFGG
ncbi:MarR family transcriptional regulator [Streptomyces sp. ISL-90]|nr:MarR family transcriptional regulator [Streptomyces sp. ISL-90]